MISLKIAIIGSSYALRVIVPALKKIKTSNLVGIYSPSIKSKNTTIKKFDSLNSLLTKNYNFLIIALPPNIQLKILENLEKIPKMLMIEKPLSGSKISKRRLLNLKKKYKNIRVLVDFNFASLAVFKYLKNYLNKTDKLTIKKVSITWNYISFNNSHSIESWKSTPSKGGGVYYNIFIHIAYLIEYLFGNFEFSNITNKNIIKKNKCCLDLHVIDNNNFPINVSINSNSNNFLFHFKLINSNREVIELINTSGDHFGKFSFFINKRLIKEFKNGNRFKDQRSNTVLNLVNNFISNKEETPNLNDLITIQIKMNNFMRLYERKL